MQKTAGQAGAKPESPAANAADLKASSGSSGSRGVRFRQDGVQSNPLYRARRNEGERRAARRVPSVETWLIMEYCNCGTLRVIATLSLTPASFCICSPICLILEPCSFGILNVNGLAHPA